jgi:ubiquinone/menaquinone biosynthesis C-methylase UbiE
MDSDRLQSEQFDQLQAQYEAHYDDPTTQAYRHRFMNSPMFDDLDLSGMQVLEAMCGSGQTTDYLLSHGASVTGLDVSRKQIDSFRRRWPQCEAICASILDSTLEDESFDCVVVVAGLHHVQPRVHAAVAEIHRVLKPGGHFCFVEPHKGSLPDSIRKVWYRRDTRFFGENEESIDLPRLKDAYASKFEFIRESYQGNIAYLFVYSSMILRLPLRLKPLYTPFLIAVESAINRLQGRLTSCFVACRWRKLQR